MTGGDHRTVGGMIMAAYIREAALLDGALADVHVDEGVLLLSRISAMDLDGIDSALVGSCAARKVRGKELPKGAGDHIYPMLMDALGASPGANEGR